MLASDLKHSIPTSQRMEVAECALSKMKKVYETFDTFLALSTLAPHGHPDSTAALGRDLGFMRACELRLGV